MSRKSEIHIDESAHEVIPSIGERIRYALISIFLGFILVNIIACWIFPGAGLAGFHMINYSYFSIISSLTNIYILAFLAICGIMGWFRGDYFIHRLKGYIEYWKFW